MSLCNNFITVFKIKINYLIPKLLHHCSSEQFQFGLCEINTSVSWLEGFANHRARGIYRGQ